MPALYTYATNATTRQVAQDLMMTRMENDPLFSILPLHLHNRLKLKWQIKDNYFGLMQLRGAGGEPRSIPSIGARMFEATPGVFGEFATIDEVELMERSGEIPDDMNVPVSVQDLVREKQGFLRERYDNRLVQMGWTLLVTGLLQLKLPGGGIGFEAQYTQQVITPPVPLTTYGTATPLATMQAWPVTYGRGSSTAWNQTAVQYMNSFTFQKLMLNSNAADLNGQLKDANGRVTPTLTRSNEIFVAYNVPQISIWDGGYVNDAGAFQMSIPDGVGLVVGKRPDNETPGETQITKNVNNPGNAPGLYSFVRDYTKGPLKTVPPKLEVHEGFNGGGVITRPSQILKVNWF